MAIANNLKQFVSAGVYKLEFDKSQIINIPASTIRLIIGFSKKGPFNTPVFVQDTNFFKTVFGDIDMSLERKGSFFHRTVLTCLNRGPVIVLNLLNLNDELDKSDFKNISTSVTFNNNSINETAVRNYFNTDKFWFTDSKSLTKLVEDTYTINNRNILNVSNVGRKTVSVLTKKSSLSGFDILVKEWFSSNAIPEFLNPNDYISDYMIDVIVVEGDFSKYKDLSIDPIYGTYFTEKGLKKEYIDSRGNIRDALESFLALDSVSVLGVYSGTLIPDFSSKNGENLYIEDLINLETSKTNILLSIDNSRFDDTPEQISGNLIDLVGHGIESDNITEFNFLSYYGSISSEIEYAKKLVSSNLDSIEASALINQDSNALLTASTQLQGASGYIQGIYDTLTIFGPESTEVLASEFNSMFATQEEFLEFNTKVNTLTSFIKGKIFEGGTALADDYLVAIESKLQSFNSNGHLSKIALKINLLAGEGVTGPTDIDESFYHIDDILNTQPLVSGGSTTLTMLLNLDFTTVLDDTTLEIGYDSKLYEDNLSGLITTGDKILCDDTIVYPITFIRNYDYILNSFPGLELTKKVNFLTATVETTSEININVDGKFTVSTLKENLNETLPLYTTGLTYDDKVTTIYFDNTSNGPFGLNGFTGRIRVGDYLVQNLGDDEKSDVSEITGKSRLTKVISVSENLDATSTMYKKIKVITNDAIYITDNMTVERYKSLESFVDTYRFHVLDGYTLRDEHLPNGTVTRQNEILDVLTNTNLFNSLTDREVINFRYIIDSFEGSIEPSSKDRLSKLAKTHASCLVIANMPSMKQFRDSTNPLFRDPDTTNILSTRYISLGGNLEKNPTNIFSLPSIADGSNYISFYGPYLQIRENGRTVNVPPSAYVSNLFIDKHNLALPYSIVAGPRRGVVTGSGLVGVEYNFDRTDLDYIEPFGYNAILNKRGIGLVINANQTAQQNIKSALSQVHVRELMIYLQDGIESILKNYHWEFNTAQNRLEIKTLVDNFCTQILSDGGIYDFDNIMDTSNNTAEIIDNNIGIIDTYIEPVRGMGVIIHRTTILKTGTISTGNYL